MAVNSTRAIGIGFTGDLNAPALTYEAGANATSPGIINRVTLAAGANTITPPTGAVGVTIVPPAGNTTNITLKGVTGDTGIVIHDTDPTSIGIDSAASTFVLTAVAQITDVQLIWT